MLSSRVVGKNRCERALGNADRGAKQHLEIGSRLDAEVQPQEPRNLVFLVGDPYPEFRIENVIAGSGVAVNLISAFVNAAFKRNPNPTLPRSAPQEILFPVVEQIEQRPGDRLDDRRLSRAVLSDDGRRAAQKILHEFDVGLDVFDFDLCDVHGGTLSDFGLGS